LYNVERLPPFWSFSQTEVYRRKPHTVEKVVLEERVNHDIALSSGKSRG
jgi:hypothetical protein